MKFTLPDFPCVAAMFVNYFDRKLYDFDDLFVQCFWCYQAWTLVVVPQRQIDRRILYGPLWSILPMHGCYVDSNMDGKSFDVNNNNGMNWSFSVWILSRASFCRFHRYHWNHMAILEVVHHWVEWDFGLIIFQKLEDVIIFVFAHLNIPGDSSPPLAMPGSDVSLRSEIDETFRRDWIESVRRTK